MESPEYQYVFEQPFNIDDPDDGIDSETKDPKCWFIYVKSLQRKKKKMNIIQSHVDSDDAVIKDMIINVEPPVLPISEKEGQVAGLPRLEDIFYYHGNLKINL